jgi:hypothetical protein
MLMFHPMTFLIAGIITHFGRKVIASRMHESDTYPCITDYWKKNPVQSALALIGAYIGYGLFVDGPDFSTADKVLLNMARMTAFGVGFMADNIADAIGSKVARQIVGTTPAPEQEPKRGGE